MVTEISHPVLQTDRRSDAHRDRFGLLPVCQQVSGAALHSAVLLHDLHLQACHLLLDGGVLPAHDVIEGPPLTLNVVDVKPTRGELESLLFQQTLAIAVELWEVKNIIWVFFSLITTGETTAKVPTREKDSCVYRTQTKASASTIVRVTVQSLEWLRVTTPNSPSLGGHSVSRAVLHP